MKIAARFSRNDVILHGCKLNNLKMNQFENLEMKKTLNHLN